MEIMPGSTVSRHKRIDVDEILARHLGEAYTDYRRRWREAGVSSTPPAFPIHIDVEMQDRCNQSCVMCPRNDTIHESLPFTINAGAVLDLGTFTRIVQEGVPRGLSSINFGGFAEPLMHKELWKFVGVAVDSGIIDTRIITNGLLLDRQLAEVFDSRLTQLFISLDAASPETYKEIRGKGYERIVKAVGLVLEERTRRDSILPIVRVSFVNMERNAHELAEFIEQWEDRVDFIDVQGWSDYRTQPVDIQSLDKIAKTFDCRSPWQRLAILADGTVLPCCDFNGKNIPVGLVTDSSLESIWTGEPMQLVRKGIDSESSLNCQLCQRGLLGAREP